MGERARIEALREIFSKEMGGVRVGIGDDAAVLEPRDGPLVWTVDEQVEGTHFSLDWASPEDVGYRSMMAAASDLAAMGASPVGALASLVLPKSFSEESFRAIARGQRAACDELGSAVVGGNLSRGPCVSLTTTWLGSAPRPVLRSGARAGQGVYVAGALGLASLGLLALRGGVAVPDAALSAWRRPVALVAAGLRMAEHASAAIDVSDGLGGDLDHLACASAVRVDLDAEALLAMAPAALLVAARALDREPLDAITEGGEDYALVCAADVAPLGFARIGTVREGEGVWLHEGPRAHRLGPGFDHFS